MATLFLIIIYASFISLGLPDSMLGVAWPLMQPVFHVPTSYAGLISMTISMGTVVSSLLSGKMIKRFGTGKVTFFSVFLTAAALCGFCFAPSYFCLLLLAVPLGLGGGAVDSGLNEYVAEHYSARHMNWLHCFWGIGAMTGPLILSFYIAHGSSWRNGYLTVSVLQFILVAVLFFTLPLWKKQPNSAANNETGTDSDSNKVVNKRGVLFPLKIKGVKTVLLAFLFYCGIETTLGLWSSSYFIHAKGIGAATAAQWVSSFYLSITVGRFVTGVVSGKLKNRQLIRTGEIVIVVGTMLMLLPLSKYVTLAGFVLIGLGCGPIFPCMLHETPARFGKENSQYIMGIQMAVAYIGSSFLPPVFGFIASNLSVIVLPLFLLFYIIIIIASSESTNRFMRAKSHDSISN